MIFKIGREGMEFNKIANFIKILINYIKEVVIVLTPIALSISKELKLTVDSNSELKKRLYYGSLFSAITLISVFCGKTIYMMYIFVILCFMIFELYKIISNIEKKNNELFTILRIWGLIYIIAFCVSLILIQRNLQGIKITFWMFVTIWSVDSIAYISGKKFGKLKLAPKISPNKTYEGAILGSIGGLFVSMVIYSFFSTNLKNSFSSISFIIFSIIVIILAQLGDLAESYIKRQCGVKDSGNTIPGHGGFLDRFDSFLFAAPFILIITWLNGGFLF